LQGRSKGQEPNFKMRIPSLSLALLAAVGLVGCATPVETSVTRFHTLPKQGTGAAFSVRPIDKKGRGEIELSEYTAKIAGHLQKYGWSQGTSNNSSIVVGYGFGITKPYEVHGEQPIIARTGGGTTWHTGTVTTSRGNAFYSSSSYTPATYSVVGSYPVTYTLYTRWLLLIAKDRKTNKDLFEIRCVSAGSSGELSQVLPAMIDSAFAEFPGKSGKTKTYSRPLR
jgi:hypothetical protein